MQQEKTVDGVGNRESGEWHVGKRPPAGLEPWSPAGVWPKPVGHLCHFNFFAQKTNFTLEYAQIYWTLILIQKRFDDLCKWVCEK